ncbi:vacuolar protein-sorting-associated protein 36 [Elysia marginata]|uniref:Vacuolar protein-sorting-associated protein 36 n=2 Tax=Elysia marginata TaxID=1093978 RepID=A0AAV4F5B0_9GAST|nr:vacuolar protein-sorting-associated protein 36 [Elysia marginata]
MDRFSWCDGSLFPEEHLVEQQGGVAVYDGHDKTPFVSGFLMLTTHRLLWRDQKNRNCVISLSLSVISGLDEQPSGFTKRRTHFRSPRSTMSWRHRSCQVFTCCGLRLEASTPNRVWSRSSQSNLAKITCTTVKFFHTPTSELVEMTCIQPLAPVYLQFYRSLKEEVKKKRWESHTAPSGTSSAATPSSSSSQGLLPRQRPGIVGIERSIQAKNKETNKNISQAFQDLRNLMEKAKDMVNLSKTIATKIKEKQGDITEDETIKFKSYLLSMGISNPVTRETHGEGDKYYSELARQLATLLTKPIEESGGMMTLTDVYCRVNRARGMELLSPEDLLHACELMEFLGLPVRLRTFDSGVSVLQAQSQNEEEVVSETSAMVEKQGNLTSEQLAQLLGLSVVLAKERLLMAEKMGGVCRDETVEGLNFYPNRFLSEA